MQVHIVLGGCVGDEHIIAVYDNKQSAEARAAQENKSCKGLDACVEPWEVLSCPTERL